MSDQGDGPAHWEGRTGKRVVQAFGSTQEDLDATATDAAKALAAERSVDITTVKGSGQEGRVTKDDVQKLIDEQDSTTS